MDSVENLLDIPIDHYVTINMQGMRDLIDAVGGIEVTNAIDFTLEGVHVPEGRITLDGENRFGLCKDAQTRSGRGYRSPKTAKRSGYENSSKSYESGWHQ